MYNSGDCPVQKPSPLIRPWRRYVTRERLEAMLDYEFLQCNLTLRTQRGDRTAFFAFADTLTTKARQGAVGCMVHVQTALRVLTSAALSRSVLLSHQHII